MLVCTRCKESKQKEAFYKNKKLKSGYNSHCKNCQKQITKLYRQTFDGLITEIYSVQRTGKQFKIPTYTKKDLKEWCKNNPIFMNLFYEWEKSEHKIELRPTLDRIDNFIGYSFENIQPMTYSDNVKKEYNDRKIGKSRELKPVLQFDIKGGFITEYFSIQYASIKTNSNQSHIGSCCSGKRKTHNGYIWKYK